jgi:hypothetical protein
MPLAGDEEALRWEQQQQTVVDMGGTAGDGTAGAAGSAGGWFHRRDRWPSRGRRGGEGGDREAWRRAEIPPQAVKRQPWCYPIRLSASLLSLSLISVSGGTVGRGWESIDPEKA